jgi:hypothetical protein
VVVQNRSCLDRVMGPSQMLCQYKCVGTSWSTPHVGLVWRRSWKHTLLKIPSIVEYKVRFAIGHTDTR